MLTANGALIIPRLLMSGHGLVLGMGVGAGAREHGYEDAFLAGDGDPAKAWHVALDQGFPRLNEDGTLECQATFGPDVALFDWREYGLFATEGPITPHHMIQATGSNPRLITRRMPGAPLHSAPKQQGQTRVLVLRVHFGASD